MLVRGQSGRSAEVPVLRLGMGVYRNQREDDNESLTHIVR
jgi:hypothetical protein